MKLVKFTKSHKSYTKGDIAGFTKELAEKLIEARVATAHNAKAVTVDEALPADAVAALKALKDREDAVASAEGDLAERDAALATNIKALDERDVALGKTEKALKARETAVASAEADLAKNAPETLKVEPAKLPGQGTKTPASTK